MSKYLDRRTDDGEPPALRLSGIDCAEANDLIPALALGAIETAERHVVRMHCQTCPDCAETLGAYQHVVNHFPFSGRLLTPPDRAKQALFARVADAQPASAVPAPQFTSVARIDVPVIDSPADKRRVPASRRPTKRPAADHGAASWPLSVLSSGVGRLATGSLALAFVLVTIYSLQALDVVDNDPVSTPPAAAGEVTTDTEAAQAMVTVQATTPAGESNAVNEETDQDQQRDAAGDIMLIDTHGASATEPVLQQMSTDAASTFVYKTVSSGGQTELLRSIAPSFADCALKATESGAYEVTVSGVSLPGNHGLAVVFLVDYSGEWIRVATIQLNEFGDGSATFTINQPLSNFRTLQIGGAQDGSGPYMSAPAFGAVSFALNSNGNRGLTMSS